ATQMGPVANQPQYRRIRELVAAGKESGATMVAGDEALGAELARGLFVRPTVFAGVSNTAGLAREEIFGPVLSIIRFGDDDEAVALANDSEFGLASAIWTNDLRRAHDVARRLVAGTVWVNTYRASAAQAPFGGVRRSGYGRERGSEALDEYLRTKNVMIDLSGRPADPFAPFEWWRERGRNEAARRPRGAHWAREHGRRRRRPPGGAIQGARLRPRSDTPERGRDALRDRRRSRSGPARASV